MNFRTFFALICIILIAGLAAAAYATFPHSAFKIGDGKDIDLNGKGIGNGSNLTAKTIGGVIYVEEYTTVNDAFNDSVVGDLLFFGPKTYSVTSEIIPKNHTGITCSARGFPADTGTIIQAGASMVSLINLTNRIDVKIENCILDGSTNTDYVINLNHTTSGSHQNTFTNLYLFGGNIATVEQTNSEDNLWDNVVFDSGNIANYGMYISTIGGQINIRKSIFENAKLAQINYTGTQTLAVSDTVFTGTTPNPSNGNIVLGGLGIVGCVNCWFEHNSISPYITGVARNIALFKPYIDGDNTSSIPTINGSINILSSTGGIIVNSGSSKNIEITGQYINFGTEVDVATAATDYFTIDSTGNMVLSGGTIETTSSGAIILKKAQDQFDFQIPGQPNYIWMSKPSDSKPFAVYNATGLSFLMTIDNSGYPTFPILAGSGNDYVCVDSTGQFFRSNTAC